MPNRIRLGKISYMIEISKIERSARKTLSVSVSADGEVIVKAPLKLPESEIYRFLNDKRSWIESKLKKADMVQNQFNDIIEYRQILLFGKRYYGYFSSQVSKITLTDNKILIPTKIKQDQLHKKITNWYKKMADDYLVRRTREVSALINIMPSGIKCTGSRGRWGACNSSRQIFLNWRCVMLPNRLIDYVIVHELAHILELNHSPRFWAVVGQILPDFKERRQELKTYGFALKLF